MPDARLLPVMVRITGDTGIPDRLIIERINTLLRGDRALVALESANERRVEGVACVERRSAERAILDMFADTRHLTIELATPVEVAPDPDAIDGASYMAVVDQLGRPGRALPQLVEAFESRDLHREKRMPHDLGAAASPPSESSSIQKPKRRKK
jgi:hypothetical protein